MKFLDNRHIKVITFSAVRTGHLYSPGNIPGTHFCYRISQPQDRSSLGRIQLMKISNNPTGNRNRDLPACRAVPQPTIPQRKPLQEMVHIVTTVS